MLTVIVGKESVKPFNVVGVHGPSEQKDYLVIPKVGATGEGTQAGIGVGFELVGRPEGGFYWGLIMSQNLIQAWRAMKLVEELPAVTPNVLAGCWSCAKSKLTASWEEKHLQELEALFENKGDFTLLRKKVLKQVPTEEVLFEAISMLLNNNIRVSSWDLKSIKNLKIRKKALGMLKGNDN